MKHFYLLLFALILVPTLSNAQKFDNALEYLEFISNEQETITKSMWNYTKAMAHSRSEKNVEAKRNSLIKSIERARKKIEKADAFENDPYKQSVLSNLELNENIVKMDYAKIIDMKEVAQQSYDLMETYIMAREMADAKMVEAQKDYEVKFYDYATRHNIDIVESETDLSKKMQISSDVFEYYNAMYLPFFKANVTESYIFEAIETNDISALQQHALSLSEIIKEERMVIDTFALYKNDRSILDATIAAFDFYQDEAEVQIPEMIEFLLLQEDVQALSELIENTPERKRTKKMIDDYNDKVKELNKQVKKYNKMNDMLNGKRQKIITGLNAANDNFLARHIPKE